MEIADLNELYRHMEWADATVWRAVLKSDAALVDVKLREWFHHLHLVQRAFLRVWRSESWDNPFPEFEDAKLLMTWGRSYYPEAFAHLESLSNEDLAKRLDLPWASMVEEQLGGAPGNTTLRETALQVPMHSLYHRGQINARLRELGGEPPLVDYIAWFWLGRPEPDWNF